MRNLNAFLIVLLIAFYLFGGDESEAPTPVAPAPPVATGQVTLRDAPAATATAEFGRADVGRQIRGSGSVVRVLSDDNDGSRHQRFILRLASGQTLLVAHNIDLAPRIDGIAVNDVVEFYGEYEWNSQGGVVHWTHHDPNGRHTNGWLRSKGRSYQ